MDPARSVELEEEGVHALTRFQYDRMVDAGVLLASDRVELLHGRLVPMSPQGWLHALVTERLVYALMSRLGDRARVRAHSPLAATDDSQPEPDVLVYPEDAARHGHPERAHLVIEVADTSLRRDRKIKAEIYAHAGVPEYWVVDLTHRCVHVHRLPGAAGYGAVIQVDPEQTLDVHAFPDVSLRLADVLPEP